MKYFTELLESYSKLKKRKLKLLEADEVQQQGNAEKEAQEAFAAAKGITPPPALMSPYVVPNKNIGIYFAKSKNAWKAGRLQRDGGVGQYQFEVELGGSLNPDYISLFSGGDQPSKDSNQPVDPSAEGMLPAAPGDEAALALQEQNVNPESIQEIVDTIKTTDSNLQELKKEYEEFKHLDLGQYERHLTSLSFKLQKKVGTTREEWDQTTQAKDPEVMLSVSQRVDQLLKTLTKTTLTAKDAEILKQFQRSGKNTIVRANPQEALVFKENTFLIRALEVAEKRFKNSKFKAKVDKYRINPASRAAGIDNAFRGTFLEDIRMIACLVASPNKDEKEIKQFIGKKYRDLGIKLNRLGKSNEKWIMDHGQTAIDTGTFDVISIFTALAGKEGEQLFRAGYAQAKATIARGAAFIATKGLVTGHGRRQDTEEVYTSIESAKKGLMLAGVREDEIGSTPEEILARGKIKGVPLREALAGDNPGVTEQNLKLARASGNFTEGQLNGTELVYTGIVSLKNYLNISKEVTVGTTTRSSNAYFVMQNYEKIPPEEHQAAQAFHAKYRETVGITESEIVATQAFHRECFGVWDRLQQITQADNIFTTSKNGTRIKQDSAEQLAKIVVGKLRDTSDHTELTDEEKSIKAKLFKTCTRYLEGREGKEGAKKRIVAYASLLGSNARIAKGIKENDPAARHYLAARLFNSGASVDDGLFVDFKSLNNNKSYSFYQNDIILDAVKSVHSGDGRWEIIPQSNGFEFVKKGTNPPQGIRLGESTESREYEGGGVSYSIKTGCALTKATIEAYNRNQDQVSEINNSTVVSGNRLVEMFIETQKKILETLMSLQKESVVK
jgi:hypothetical protein